MPRTHRRPGRPARTPPRPAPPQAPDGAEHVLGSGGPCGRIALVVLFGLLPAVPPFYGARRVLRG